MKQAIARGTATACALPRRIHARWTLLRMGWKMPGSFEEMTGRAWIFVAVIVVVLLVFGPKVLTFVENALGTSINTTSNAFNFPVS